MKKLSKLYRIYDRISSKLSAYKSLELFAIFFNNIYLNAVQNFLRKNYSYILDIAPTHIKKNKRTVDNKRYIWVCWFQGVKTAPLLVKNCIKNIQCKAGNHKVIILDEQNMLDYAYIPDYIIQKYKKEIITKQNFSDILRFALLSQNGGAWIDSTIFLTKTLDEELFSREVYSIKNSRGSKYNISQRRWTAYFWICKKDSYFAKKVFQFFCEYWKDNDELIDYFLIDHIIAFLYKNDSKIKNILDSIPENNLHVTDLQKELLNQYNKDIFDNLNKDTSIFKLSWKIDYSIIPKNSTYKFIFNFLEE